MMSSRPETDFCDDGLDADGYPISEPWRKPYVHGDESDAGNFCPVSIGDALAPLLARIERFREIGDSTDSPIEDMMGAALLLFFERAGHPLKLCKNIDLKIPPQGLLLVPQFKWSFYRSDWAIYNAETKSALLIECDGAAFHSSPDQIAHDRKTDAAAQDRGWLTMRFAGWRINKDADSLAQNVYDAVMGWF